MIATLSAEEQNLWETISTCRFSQRVACITNTARYSPASQLSLLTGCDMMTGGMRVCQLHVDMKYSNSSFTQEKVEVH